VPQNICNHPGFIAILKTNSTGFGEREKELCYASLMQVAVTEERLQMHLDGIVNTSITTVGSPDVST